jgi:hypothetical protein
MLYPNWSENNPIIKETIPKPKAIFEYFPGIPPVLNLEGYCGTGIRVVGVGVVVGVLTCPTP